jgi:thiosulfate/3-mercaptopyruvate sulfurtransferase
VKRFLEPAEIPADAVLLDARPSATYEAGHIPGARPVEFTQKFFIRDPQQLGALNAAVQNLARGAGLSAGQRVVVYDVGRDNRATRVAWALEYAGFEVALLREGVNGFHGTFETAPATIAASDFTLSHPRRELLATADEVLARDANTVVVDARNAKEFSGEQAVSGSTRGGHIPGAINLNWEDLTTPTGLQDDTKLGEKLSAIPKNAEIIVHCQSGARSSVLYHALKSQGYNVKNYVGSMNEWVADEALPLEKDAEG